MVDEISIAPSVQNVIPKVDKGDIDEQKDKEKASDVRTEETSNLKSTRRAEKNEESPKARAKETDRAESAQRGNEANEKLPTAQNKTRGTNVDILS